MTIGQPSDTAPMNLESGRSIEWVSERPDSKFIGAVRSEEHTSELQSRVDLVCRLLLEKKSTDDPTASSGGFARVGESDALADIEERCSPGVREDELARVVPDERLRGVAHRDRPEERDR